MTAAEVTPCAGCTSPQHRPVPVLKNGGWWHLLAYRRTETAAEVRCTNPAAQAEAWAAMEAADDRK